MRAINPNRPRRLPRPFQLLEAFLALLCMAAVALALLIAVALMSGCVADTGTDSSSVLCLGCHIAPFPDAPTLCDLHHLPKCGPDDAAPPAPDLLCWNHRPPPCPPPPDGPQAVDAALTDCSGGGEGSIPCLCPTSGEVCTTASQSDMCVATGACFLPDGHMPAFGHLARLPDGSYVCVPGGDQPCIYP